MELTLGLRVSPCVAGRGLADTRAACSSLALAALTLAFLLMVFCTNCCG